MSFMIYLKIHLLGSRDPTHFVPVDSMAELENQTLLWRKRRK